MLVKNVNLIKMEKILGSENNLNLRIIKTKTKASLYCYMLQECIEPLCIEQFSLSKSS